MKKINLSIIAICFLIVTLGCSKNNKNPEEFFGFKEYQTVTGNRLAVSDNIQKAYELLVVGELLIVSNPNFQYHFTIIDLNEEKKVAEFGKMGYGPCELSFPASLQLTGNGSNVVGVNNRNKFSYQEFNLSSVLSQNNKLDTCINTTSNFNLNYHKLIKVQDSLFVGTGSFEKRFAVSKTDEKLPSEFFGEYPFSKDLAAFNHHILSIAYQGDILMRPSGGKFVSTSRSSFNFDIVRIGLNGSLELENATRFWPPSFGGNSGSLISTGYFISTMESDNKYGCLSTSVSDNFIYILYSGKTMKENAMYSNTILVYDWNGNPIKVLELDQQLNLISVSQNDDYLIGSVDDGEANLYKYKLK
ncbi:BF3164 family lipoprotein [Aquiflexum lacus]|uniref:BF3164 family lipoprotein n=1 Tax=Aquiflexum lacus TaxID=2483805 RepID=UPI0018948B2A|nr:BF3164 family lipoprotein [Aquiflexum lacus]